MSYILLKSLEPIATAWTEEDTVLYLRHMLHSRPLLLPDDEWYTKAADDADLNNQAEKIGRHLMLRYDLPDVRFFDDMESDGSLILDDVPEILVNKKYRHNPYKCSAIIAHAICHYALIKRRVLFSEISENEKAADLMSIEGGLGIVILNGMSGLGWQNHLKKLIKNPMRDSGLGYFTPKAYTRRFKAYLQEQHIPINSVAAHLLPWINTMSKSDRAQVTNAPDYVKAAQRKHKASMMRFTLGGFVVIASISLMLTIALRHPAFMSDELKEQRQYVEQLSNSYESCVRRVQELQKHKHADDHFMKRIAEAEITTCKSLQNRYNNEVRTYNQMLNRHD